MFAQDVIYMKKKQASYEMENKNYEEALRIYLEIEKDNHGECQIDIARCFYMLDEYQKAKSVLAGIIQNSDPDGEAHYLYGCILAQSDEKPEKSIEYFREAISRGCDQAWSMYGLEVALLFLDYAQLPYSSDILCCLNDEAKREAHLRIIESVADALNAYAVSYRKTHKISEMDFYGICILFRILINEANIMIYSRNCYSISDYYWAQIKRHSYTTFREVLGVEANDEIDRYWETYGCSKSSYSDEEAYETHVNGRRSILREAFSVASIADSLSLHWYAEYFRTAILALIGNHYELTANSARSLYWHKMMHIDLYIEDDGEEDSEIFEALFDDDIKAWFTKFESSRYNQTKFDFIMPDMKTQYPGIQAPRPESNKSYVEFVSEKNHKKKGFISKLFG